MKKLLMVALLLGTVGFSNVSFAKTLTATAVITDGIGSISQDENGAYAVQTGERVTTVVNSKEEAEALASKLIGHPVRLPAPIVWFSGNPNAEADFQAYQATHPLSGPKQ